jgi:hypothetical protein
MNRVGDAIARGEQYLNTRTLWLVVKPVVCLRRWVRSKSKTLPRMDVMRTNLVWWHLFAPVGSEAIGGTECDLNVVFIEYERPFSLSFALERSELFFKQSEPQLC